MPGNMKTWILGYDRSLNEVISWPNVKSTGPSKSIQLPISQNATFSAHFKIRILEFCIYSIRYKRNICSFILVPALCRHPVFNIQIFTCWLLQINFLLRMRRKLLDTFNRTHDYLRWAFNEFHFRWLENSVIDIGKAAMFPLIFNHLKWNPFLFFVSQS